MRLASVNSNHYYSSPKVFTNLRHLAPPGQNSQVRDFTKPDELRIFSKAAELRKGKNRLVLSKHHHWITVEEPGLQRRNAPECTKAPQTELMLNRVKPMWMERKPVDRKKCVSTLDIHRPDAN